MTIHARSNSVSRRVLLQTAAAAGGGFLLAFTFRSRSGSFEHGIRRHSGYRPVCSQRVHPHRSRCKVTLVIPQVEMGQAFIPLSP